MNTWRGEIRMGFDEEQAGDVGDPYLQKVWETCGVQSPACPSIREADRGQASTESGEAQQVAAHLLGPHGTLRNQLGKLGLSASRLVVLIKGWGGGWEIAPRFSLAGGRQVFLSRCS